MRSHLSLFLATVLLATVAVPATIQGQGIAMANVYRDQFFGLHDRIGNTLNKSKAVVSSGSSRAERSAMLDELLALITLVHRLEEETARTAISQTIEPAVSKRLRLVAQGCAGLDFMIKALQNFLDTEDNAFLSFANDEHGIVGLVRKLL